MIGVLVACVGGERVAGASGEMPALGAPMPEGAAYTEHLDGWLESCVSVATPAPEWRALACGCEGRVCQVVLRMPADGQAAAEGLVERRYPGARVVSERWPTGAMVRVEDGDATDAERARVTARDAAARAAACDARIARCGAARARFATHVEEPPAYLGAIDRERAAAALARGRGRVASCEQVAWMADPCTMGELRLRLSVEAGRVRDVALLRNSTGSEPLGACVQRALRAVRFDERDSGGVEQSWLVEGALRGTTVPEVCAERGGG